MSIMQELYDSEINVSISTFWDGGYDLKLGDDMNGFRAEGNVDFWEQIEPWFTQKALEHWPDSDFALAHRQAT